MLPIKITDNIHINPQAVLYTDYSEQCGESGNPMFTIVFQNPEFLPRYLHGAEAQVAAENWKRALQDAHAKMADERTPKEQDTANSGK